MKTKKTVCSELPPELERIMDLATTGNDQDVLLHQLRLAIRKYAASERKAALVEAVLATKFLEPTI
jgi:hypothetical protein